MEGEIHMVMLMMVIETMAMGEIPYLSVAITQTILTLKGVEGVEEDQGILVEMMTHHFLMEMLIAVMMTMAVTLIKIIDLLRMDGTDSHEG